MVIHRDQGGIVISAIPHRVTPETRPKRPRNAAEVETTAVVLVGCQAASDGQPDASCGGRQLAEVKTTSARKPMGDRGIIGRPFCRLENRNTCRAYSS